MSSLWGKKINASANIRAQICSGNLHPTENGSFVEVRALKKLGPDRDRDWTKTAVGITGLRENFVRDGGID